MKSLRPEATVTVALSAKNVDLPVRSAKAMSVDPESYHLQFYILTEGFSISHHFTTVVLKRAYFENDGYNTMSQLISKEVYKKQFIQQIFEPNFIYHESSFLDSLHRDNRTLVWIQGIIIRIESTYLGYLVFVDDGSSVVPVKIATDNIEVALPELRCYIGDLKSYKNIQVGDYLVVQGHLQFSAEEDSQVRENSRLRVDYVVAKTYFIAIDPNAETLWQLEVILSYHQSVD